jgi:hypothetical protein
LGFRSVEEFQRVKEWQSLRRPEGAPFLVFHEKAGVFDDREAGGVSFRGCRGVGNSLLEPEDFGADGDGGVREQGNIFGAAEDVDDVDGFGNVFEARVGSLAEDFGFVGIDGNDLVPGGLEVGGDGVGGTETIGGEADDGDGLQGAKDVGDGVGERRDVGGKVKKHEHWMRKGQQR